MQVININRYKRLKKIEKPSFCCDERDEAFLTTPDILEKKVNWLVSNSKRNPEAIEVFDKYMPHLISEDDSDWLFLIQGLTGFDEVASYFIDIAEELGYEINDPITDYRHPLVAEKAGISREDAALSNIILSDMNKKEVLGLSIDYDLGFSMLQKANENFSLRRERGDPSYELLVEKAVNNLQKLYDTSNEISRKNIESIISQNPYKDFFIYTDINSVPIIEYLQATSTN